MKNVDVLYRYRFAESDLPAKNRIWKTLCDTYFHKIFDQSETVVDLACGFGEFINNINVKDKIGVDINPDSPSFLSDDVKFIEARSDNISGLVDASVDSVFTSNFLEHLESKSALTNTFDEIFRVLKPGGKFVIMGPNIRYVYDKYWDFFDHHLPLSEVTIEEALALSGFAMQSSLPRFLPFSTRSSLPQSSWIIRLYLAAPLLWPLFGKQFLVIGRKPG
jgi:SAM-dependent methyltransferase